MPLWKNLLKPAARGADDVVSAMFDEIIKIKPELKGALTYIKNEYKVGNISGEAAKRAANMAERSAGARDAAVSDRTGVKILGDYGASRASAREAMSRPEFKMLDERINDFDLKGNEAVDAAERNIRAKKARAADVIDDDYQAWDKQAYEDFDKAIADRYKSLDRDDRYRYLDIVSENTPIEHYRNAIKSGLSQQDAIESTRRQIEQMGGPDMDFNGVTEYLRRNGVID